jgi:hypothetical protein
MVTIRYVIQDLETDGNNFKIINAQESKTVINCRNIKFKLLRNNASILVNIQCKTNHLTPTNAQKNTKKNNRFNQNTKPMGTKFRINLEIQISS